MEPGSEAETRAIRLGATNQEQLDGYQFKIKLLKLIYFLITVTKKAPKIKISPRVAIGFIRGVL